LGTAAEKKLKKFDLPLDKGLKTYKLIIPTSDITDFSFFSKPFTTTNGVTTTVNIHYYDLTSPGWGQSQSMYFNESLITGVQWQTNDGASGPFSIEISDLTLN
jgi:hypothetical protein